MNLLEFFAMLIVRIALLFTMIALIAAGLWGILYLMLYWVFKGVLMPNYEL